MMRANATLCLESTIPSYLAAWPSRDLIVAAQQQITHEWWRQARPDFDIYISPVVLGEIREGDPDAAARRLALVEGIPLLAVTEGVEALAREYENRLGLPPAARVDLLHLACAVVYPIDYLLTWNCAHLANGRVIQRLHVVNGELGRRTPIILTPAELLDPSGGD
jgi:hypothetical protein